MKKQSGFTLIELMVVMAIIAILATAGLTAYSNYLKKARDSARLQTARQLMTKVEELAGGGLLPSPTQLVTFLEAENFAFAPLPTAHPVIASVGGLINSVLGTTFALTLDPMQGELNCYDRSTDTFATHCYFVYGVLPDQTYFIAYPVEHRDNIKNLWQTYYYYDGSLNLYYYGNVIGTSPYLTEDYGATYNWDMNTLFYDTAKYPVAPDIGLTYPFE